MRRVIFHAICVPAIMASVRVPLCADDLFLAFVPVQPTRTIPTLTASWQKLDPMFRMHVASAFEQARTEGLEPWYVSGFRPQDLQSSIEARATEGDMRNIGVSSGAPAQLSMHTLRWAVDIQVRTDRYDRWLEILEAHDLFAPFPGIELGWLNDPNHVEPLPGSQLEAWMRISGTTVPSRAPLGGRRNTYAEMLHMADYERSQLYSGPHSTAQSHAVHTSIAARMAERRIRMRDIDIANRQAMENVRMQVLSQMLQRQANEREAARLERLEAARQRREGISAWNEYRFPKLGREPQGGVSPVVVDIATGSVGKSSIRAGEIVMDPVVVELRRPRTR